MAELRVVAQADTIDRADIPIGQFDVRNSRAAVII